MIRMIFTEKKQSISTHAINIMDELNSQLKETIVSLRFFSRYDIEGLDEKYFKLSLDAVFSEPPIDDIYLENLPPLPGYTIFAVEYLPGQYDMRADSAEQCICLLSSELRPHVCCASVYAVKGEKDIEKIKKYLINPVDSRIAALEKPVSLVQETYIPPKVKIIENFRFFDIDSLNKFHIENNLAMSIDDLEFIRQYFIKEERDPTETEITILDTYWSDHCRHTTFLTELSEIKIETETPEIMETYSEYKNIFAKHYSNKKEKYECLMDMATIGVKELKSRGLLKNLDESEEINACSVKTKIETTLGIKDYLIMFKNETHNHPTEIEPFGGAATCLGGAIRDPLSGRSYVFQAMRISGAADITLPIENTKVNKLPQRIISRDAALGFSSYGNQIGLATGIVAEVYHSSYEAKRLETGFVVGAAPLENVKREKPIPGDLVLLIGGDTGCDGCGGATGSSKAHDEDSMSKSGAEVQKGNPITERKLQRLFRNPEFSLLVKRCNDFGAGGVCVAVGELSDGVLINLDAIPKKYEGLSGTELAISESQERMAIVISKQDLEKITQLCREENIKLTPIAVITDSNSMVMKHNGMEIVNLKRSLLSSNGVKVKASALINDKAPPFMNEASNEAAFYLNKKDYASALEAELSRLNITSNKGMAEMFDSTIGSGSVFMPFGGKKQLTPSLVMAAKIPLYPVKANYETDTAAVSAWGFDPYLMSQSPFVGAQYSILLSVAKLCSSGVPYESIYLSLQEYFKKTGVDPLRWGEPVSAMLGALRAQLKLGLAAIGGKDSMSGTYLDSDVSPTLISFALGIADLSKLIGNVLYEGAKVYRISLLRNSSSCPDYEYFIKLMKFLTKNINNNKINFCTVVETGGAASSITASCLGNGIGFNFIYCKDDLFYPLLGDIIIAGNFSENEITAYDFKLEYIGEAGGDQFNFGKNGRLDIEKAENAYLRKLSSIFPINAEEVENVKNVDYKNISFFPYSGKKIAAPRALIPVFPGTNCEYDTEKKLLDAGAKTETFIFNNLNNSSINTSIKKLANLIINSEIIVIPGGFSGGDEPDGSAKFIAAVFRSPLITEAVTEFLEKRQGLMLGICNGFQALIKLGLLPFGKIMPMTSDSPTLCTNKIGKHISTLSRIRVSSVDSPWLSNVNMGDIFLTPVSHGEGRLIAPDELLENLVITGRICTQYADDEGKPAGIFPHNPNGSLCAIEGLISPCGRILGKMGHIERTGKNLYKNVPEVRDMNIFSSGVRYFS